MGRLSTAYQPKFHQPLFLDHDFVNGAAVQGDAKIGFYQWKDFFGAVGPTDFLVGCDQNAERQVLLTTAHADRGGSWEIPSHADW